MFSLTSCVFCRYLSTFMLQNTNHKNISTKARQILKPFIFYTEFGEGHIGLNFFRPSDSEIQCYSMPYCIRYRLHNAALTKKAKRTLLVSALLIRNPLIIKYWDMRCHTMGRKKYFHIHYKYKPKPLKQKL